MKLLPILLCAFLLIPTTSFAKGTQKKVDDENLGQEKEFSWQDENTWGAHPPSAEDMGGEARNQESTDYNDRDFSWDDEDTWGAHPPSAEEMDQPRKGDRHERHHPRRKERVDYYDYLAMKMAYRCGKAKKTQDDCHACTDSTADFNACMAGETEKTAVMHTHDYAVKKEPHGKGENNRENRDAGKAKAAR